MDAIRIPDQTCSECWIGSGPLGGTIAGNKPLACGLSVRAECRPRCAEARPRPTAIGLGAGNPPCSYAARCITTTAPVPALDRPNHLRGRWPDVTRTRRATPRAILVSHGQIEGSPPRPLVGVMSSEAVELSFGRYSTSANVCTAPTSDAVKESLEGLVRQVGDFFFDCAVCA